MSKATPIPAPLSRSVEVVMYLSGIPCLFGALMVLMWRVGQVGLPLGLSLGATFLMAFQAGIGGGLLMMPGWLRQGRDQLLAKRRESSETDDPTPIEDRPPAPDLVVISILWGGLSIISWPMLFAPAGIVCGILAAAKGHFKGLIGVVLGLVGLAGFVFLMIYLADK